jgi:hypothetical protein
MKGNNILGGPNFLKEAEERRPVSIEGRCVMNGMNGFISCSYIRAHCLPGWSISQPAYQLAYKLVY